MNASHHQKQDLIQFGLAVQRLAVARVVTERNAGRLNEDEANHVLDYMPTGVEVMRLLDTFEPKVDVASALAELEPMVLLMRKSLLRGGKEWEPVFRQYLTRVEAAIRYLKVDPR